MICVSNLLLPLFHHLVQAIDSDKMLVTRNLDYLRRCPPFGRFVTPNTHGAIAGMARYFSEIYIPICDLPRSCSENISPVLANIYF